jgi:hypothetical protein
VKDLVPIFHLVGRRGFVASRIRTNEKSSIPY